MPRKIRAAICRRFGEPLSVETVTLADPGPGEVRVTMKACAICHSDIIYADGGWGGTLPMVLGHEAAGIIDAIGPGVTRVKPGDRVCVTLIRSCGGCHYCAAGAGYHCEATFALDAETPLHDGHAAPLVHGLRTGAFAEAVVVEQSQVVAVGDDIPFEVASLMSCGVITGVGAVTNTVKMPAGSHAVVIGCGGVGLNTVQGARISGARTITAVDLSETKLDVARGFGATHVVNPAKASLAGAVMDTTAGRGADFVFVTVGAKQAIEGAMEAITKLGTVVVVGMPPSDVMTAYNPSNLAGWSQRIVGSKMGSARISRDIPWLADLYRRGDLKLDEMVSGRFALDEINKAIDSTRKGEALRNVIVFD